MPVNRVNSDRLLVLDDNVELAELIGQLARKAGYATTVTTETDAFNAALEEKTPDVIVLDLQMPQADGIEVLRQLAAAKSIARILLVSGMDRQTVTSAKRFGQQLGLNILDAVQKPFKPEALVTILSKARSATGQLSASDLANAIDSAELVLRFQPIIRRLGSGVWHADSVEALPRWNHPEFGVLTPAQFIPLIASEKGELMRQLSDFVLLHGARQLQRWQSDGLHLGLRVNVPAGLISDTDFPDRLECLLDEQGVDPTLLTLELTDTMSLVDSTDGVEIVTRLRLKGIKLSIDDFGGGASAIPPLYTLPISEVKVDPRIIADLVCEPAARTVFSGISRMLRNLDIDCCAEGVESREQLDALDNLKCDLAQGYYIGMPMPASDIPNSIDTWTADSMPRTSAG